ncbi:MAG: sigma-70 family RNA polymerase sigma factor [Candidatus Enteromonas sp.]|nr:sigma-70 family RNA polymerase sigma factor [Candidatus Enteromonas sp.]
MWKNPVKTLESRLKQALKLGNSDAIKQCCSEAFEAYERLVFHVAYQVLRNEEMAKDALIEAFLSFMSNLNSLEFSSVKYYLVKASKQIAMRMLCKNGLQVEYDGDIATKGQSEVDICAKLDVESALACLDDEERKIVILKIEYGYKFKEIGEELGISENAASSKYTRSIKKMKRHLERRT